jgi:hypothetical protein
MAKYCITAANHKNANDDRASEFQVWKYVQKEDKTWVWRDAGKQSLNQVAALLAQGDQVVSATVENEDGKSSMKVGYPIELELRIAKNDKKFKITDLPTF